MIYLLLAIVAALVIAGVPWLFRPRAPLRSPREVADILKQFVSGEPTGFMADEFIHVPIGDPEMDALRERFEQLADQCPEWEPQAPFPDCVRADLDRVIAEAEALATRTPNSGG